jgi:hypothetical protein
MFLACSKPPRFPFRPPHSHQASRVCQPTERDGGWAAKVTTCGFDVALGDFGHPFCVLPSSFFLPPPSWPVLRAVQGLRSFG